MKAVLAIAVLLVVAPSAHAAGWSTPRVFSAGSNPEWEPAPRAAVAVDGTSLVVWTNDDDRLVASFGDRRGRFSSPVTVARGPHDFAVATGAVAYEADGRFKRTSAPSGQPPAPFHSNSTNRDARAAGRHAIVTWAAGRTVRVSVRQF